MMKRTCAMRARSAGRSAWRSDLQAGNRMKRIEVVLFEKEYLHRIDRAGVYFGEHLALPFGDMGCRSLADFVFSDCKVTVLVERLDDDDD